jgi:hypothetical protein
MLIDEYLENDKDLSKILKNLSEKELLKKVPSPLTKENQMIALKKAKRVTLFQTIIIGLVVGLLAMAFLVLVVRMPIQ